MMNNAMSMPMQYDGVMSPNNMNREFGGINRQPMPVHSVNLSMSFTDHTNMLSAAELRSLSAKLQENQHRASTYYNQEFSIKAASAWARYYGEDVGNSPEGYSGETTRESMQVIDRMTEACMRATFEQGTIINFSPHNTPDNQQNDLDFHMMSRHCENIIREAPESKKMLEQFALTGLTEGVAFLRVESYKPPNEDGIRNNMNVFDVVQMDRDPDVQIIEHAVEFDQTYPEGKKIHIRFKRKMPHKTLIQFVPNSQMLWQRNAVSFDQTLPNGCSYIGHIQLLPINEIIRQLPSAAKVIDYGFPSDETDQIYHDYREQIYSAQIGDLYSDQRYGDSPMQGRRIHGLLDEYVKFDLDGDGQDEIVCVRRVGTHILHISPVMDNPFVCWVPKASPARAVGQSLDDKVNDVQRQSTDMTRGIMNTMSLAQVPRVIVNMSTNAMSDISPDQTLTDLENTSLGGIVRASGPPGDAVQTYGVIDPNLPLHLMMIRDKIRMEVQERTGIGSAMTGATDPNVGRTATGTHMSQQTSTMPARAIISNYGEGMKVLAKKTLRCEIMNGGMVYIRMNGEYHQADPRQWAYNVIVKVNLSGALINPDQRQGQLETILNLGIMTMQHLGPDNPVYNLTHFSNSFEELIRTMSFSDASRFVGDVTEQQMAEIAEQMRQSEEDGGEQAEMMKIQLEHQVDLQKLEMEWYEMQMKQQLELIKLYAETNQKEQQMVVEAKLETLRMQMNEDIEKKKIEAQKQVAKTKSVGPPVKVGGDKTG